MNDMELRIPDISIYFSGDRVLIKVDLDAVAGFSPPDGFTEATPSPTARYWSGLRKNLAGWHLEAIPAAEGRRSELTRLQLAKDLNDYGVCYEWLLPGGGERLDPHKIVEKQEDGHYFYSKGTLGVGTFSWVLIPRDQVAVTRKPIENGEHHFGGMHITLKEFTEQELTQIGVPFTVAHANCKEAVAVQDQLEAASVGFPAPEGQGELIEVLKEHGWVSLRQHAERSEKQVDETEPADCDEPVEAPTKKINFREFL